MAGKLTYKLLAIFALISNPHSNSLVTAVLQGADQGVVRIDLEKRYLHHYDNVQLDQATDANLIIESPVPIDEEVMLDGEELNYS
jgi:hypothetical protein